MDEGECYKYLGQDKNTSHVDTVNKERVSKEYFTRVRNIWKPKLSAFNKTIAHNMSFFFLSGFSFANIHDSRDSRGRGRLSI